MHACVVTCGGRAAVNSHIHSAELASNVREALLATTCIAVTANWSPRGNCMCVQFLQGVSALVASCELQAPNVLFVIPLIGLWQ